MRTVVLGPRPHELEAMIEHRRRIGADTHDEVWEGEYHMAPAPNSDHAQLEIEVAFALRPFAVAAGLIVAGPANIGDKDDYRVPGLVIMVKQPRVVWLRSAALVVEILSPHDETWSKLGFYAAHEVDEVVVVEPTAASLTWLERRGESYDPVDRSMVLGVDVAEVAAAISWP